MLDTTEAREIGHDTGELVVFDVHHSTWTPTGSAATGRPVWEYLAPVTQGDLLIGVPDRFSVHGFGWPPNFRAPTHFHDVDQIQLVVSGMASMGSRVLRPGDGVFTPAGRSYNFQTGRNGATILEFRSSASFATAYKERDAAMLGRLVERDASAVRYVDAEVPLSIPGFTPPEHAGKPSFFSATNTPVAPARPAAWHGQSNLQIPWQSLVEPPGDDGYRLGGFVVQPSAHIETHTAEVPRVWFVFGGSVELDEHVIGPGMGMYVPTGTELAAAAGPSGSHVLEFSAPSPAP